MEQSDPNFFDLSILLITNYYLPTFNFHEAEALLLTLKTLNKAVQSPLHEITLEILRARCYPKLTQKERALAHLFKADRYIQMLGTTTAVTNIVETRKLRKECNVVKREICLLSKELVLAHGITFKMSQIDPSDSSEKLWYATLNLYMEDHQSFEESMMSYLQLDQPTMSYQTLKMLSLILYYLNLK